MKCDWPGCTEVAVVVKHDSQGRSWSRLCSGHANQYNRVFDEAIMRPSVKNTRRLLGAMVKANGGYRRISEKM